MYFNEIKYKKCINHLIEIKIIIVISYLIMFALIGIETGFYIIYTTNKEELVIVIITGIIGAIIGLIIGLFSTWRVEMKIQEAYWRIDTLNELQKQSTLANKNTPIAKTIVAIENKSNQQEDKKEEIKN